MHTECNGKQMEFHALGRRCVRGSFDGGRISSDGGGLLLREVERHTRVIERLGGCFTDHRDAERIEHELGTLVAQRVYALALGYEDLNDHQVLRGDALLALLSGKTDVEGRQRLRARDVGHALAGACTLNRLELTPDHADERSRYKKVVADFEAMDELLLSLFIESHTTAPQQLILDVDATDDPLHGQQQGRYFHGYYGQYCYLPLYIVCGEQVLCARLRTADVDPGAGIVVELERIVARLRAVWPQVEIIVRGDSGFCREQNMAWCEANGVHYLFGLARNARLNGELAGAMQQAKAAFAASGQAARVFHDFHYQTRESWSCARRVVGKAEYLPKGENPRYVVTSLPSTRWAARTLYEQLYCARGEMENRIKEQMMLFADRTSTALFRANQLRLYFSTFAYCLMQALRRLGLTGTELARSQCDTLRVKLLKIGANIRVSVRKIWVSLSSSYPYAELFKQIYTRLRALPAPS
jgi:Transposase DDE domain group 1